MSFFLQSETVFLAMVWGHAMHSLELAAAAPRLEQSVCWVYSCLFSWPEGSARAAGKTSLGRIIIIGSYLPFLSPQVAAEVVTQAH